MAIKRNNTKSAHVFGAQLKLYHSVDDCSVVLESAHGSSKQQKSAKEIEAHNRVAATQYLFVFKEHRATRHHFDLRIEWNRVMVSWAIPEGPSYYPGHKREAIQVEDHAREYAGREGIIPEGSPGAGEVMLWDAGICRLQPGYTDVGVGLRDGYLKLKMDGIKIKGNWTLVRITKGDCFGRKPVWHLIKDPDEFARGPQDPSIVQVAPHSIASGRLLKEIAERLGKGRDKNTFQLDLFQSNLGDGECSQQADVSSPMPPSRERGDQESTKIERPILDGKTA